MNKLTIETKNGLEYWAHVNDANLEDFVLALKIGYNTFVDVLCEKTKRTIVFNRVEISSYSYGKIEEESQ